MWVPKFCVYNLQPAELPVFGVEDDIVVSMKETAVLSYEHFVLDEVSVVQTVQLMKQHRVQLPERDGFTGPCAFFFVRSIEERTK